ncbi:hypothetical protein [Streptomyces scopuliridis]|uniref:hypothetical protein n=1 Tax=Streptomyces scopuliridis TaxID=452529 RepID=UPI0004C21629|nr:hypothetical protein [Streptomyces scopuliridis]
MTSTAARATSTTAADAGPDEDKPVELKQLAEFSRCRLVLAEIPRQPRLMDTFPIAVCGKVRKVELREAAAREPAAE